MVEVSRRFQIPRASYFDGVATFSVILKRREANMRMKARWVVVGNSEL